MEINTRDLEYGYPSLERGIGFVASTHVSFLEVLRYKAVDEDEKVEVLNEKGELREGEIGRWLMKVGAKMWTRVKVGNVTCQ